MHKIITSLYYPSVVVYTPYPLHIKLVRYDPLCGCCGAVGLGRRLRPTGSPLLHEQCRDGQGSYPWPFHLLSCDHHAPPPIPTIYSTTQYCCLFLSTCSFSTSTRTYKLLQASPCKLLDSKRTQVHLVLHLSSTCPQGLPACSPQGTYLHLGLRLERMFRPSSDFRDGAPTIA